MSSRSSPELPSYGANVYSTTSFVPIEDVSEEELEEDVADQQVIIENALTVFDTLKEIIKKESEGALAKKTISDYERYKFYITSEENMALTLLSVYGSNFSPSPKMLTQSMVWQTSRTLPIEPHTTVPHGYIAFAMTTHILLILRCQRRMRPLLRSHWHPRTRLGGCGGRSLQHTHMQLRCALPWALALWSISRRTHQCGRSKLTTRIGAILRCHRWLRLIWRVCERKRYASFLANIYLDLHC